MADRVVFEDIRGRELCVAEDADVPRIGDIVTLHSVHRRVKGVQWVATSLNAPRPGEEQMVALGVIVFLGTPVVVPAQ